MSAALCKRLLVRAAYAASHGHAPDADDLEEAARLIRCGQRVELAVCLLIIAALVAGAFVAVVWGGMRA